MILGATSSEMTHFRLILYGERTQPLQELLSAAAGGGAPISLDRRRSHQPLQEELLSILIVGALINRGMRSSYQPRQGSRVSIPTSNDRINRNRKRSMKHYWSRSYQPQQDGSV
jgi:hypothetical protein